ncbi:helix-turn-helix transcriptional regulator [Amycolatopsis sp. NPDC089917]|uniref:helix-turn-helix transcriptional regulator n=1 Tax=Amycolatopsis sp. NPDC089917 TaxID=3155187 RepID=UPI003427BE64
MSVEPTSLAVTATSARALLVDAGRARARAEQCGVEAFQHYLAVRSAVAAARERSFTAVERLKQTQQLIERTRRRLVEGTERSAGRQRGDGNSFGIAPVALTAEDHRDIHPDTVRRAVAFIDGNAHQDLTVADIAAAINVSVRTVQAAFRRHLEITPTGYLRRVRLAHAHADLVLAGPGSTVSDIAARWGFFQPGRFAASYRTLYGCAPRETLLRRGHDSACVVCRLPSVLTGSQKAA